MVISKKNRTPTCNIVMNGTVLKQVHKYNYLGSLLTSDGRCTNEIKRRMAHAKASFQNTKSILWNKRLSLGMRKRVLKCYIEPILLYGCESWSMTKQTLTSIEAIEMWFLRRMLRVSWTEKTTTLDIINKPSSTRKLMSNQNTRRYSSPAGKKHCGDVYGCKRSRKVECHDRLSLQQTWQLKKENIPIANRISNIKPLFRADFPLPVSFKKKLPISLCFSARSTLPHLSLHLG